MDSPRRTAQLLHAWHHQAADQVLHALASGERGLHPEDARQRLAEYGPNLLPQITSKHPLKRLLQQFNNLLIIILLIAALGTLALGQVIDAAVIMAVVLINAAMGFLQEGRAERALHNLRQLLAPTAEVIRGGQHLTLDTRELVPGDLVLLHTGDRVPADLRLVSLKGFKVQEASLTGESAAVDKDLYPVSEQALLADRRCMAFAGTLVSHGQATGVVVNTGLKTEIGRISDMVTRVAASTTPLVRQMRRFGRGLTLAILAIATATFAIGTLRHGYGATEMFLASVVLAVAAIPEGLPAIMTITLALGVERMARRNAIIRVLPAVETLGAVSVICSDKTGTLTRNEMTVRTATTSNLQFNFSGSGYQPHGVISSDDVEVDVEHHPVLGHLLRAAVLCNESRLQAAGDGRFEVVGDPMEAALLVAGLKAGIDHDLLGKQFPRTDLIPFEPDRRFMASLHHSHDGRSEIYIKGAPEQVLAMCNWQKSAAGDLEPLNAFFWEEQLEKMAVLGQRVLAVAFKPAHQDHRTLTFKEVDHGLIMLGLLGLMDPPRDEAICAVARCREAGIRVKMMTGDHAATARTIACQLRLVNPVDALTGEEISQLADDQLLQLVEDVDIYARVDPAHKLELVRLLQSRGHIVAMTGDGINDAPALKRADVGIAMGYKGTDAARDASEMVLADDNFASISHAVEEGRTVYDNLKKAILFILPTNGGEALIVLTTVLLGFSHLPLTPVQMLWVNMITAVTLAVALAFEPAEARVMHRPPRDPLKPLLSPLLLWRVAFVSAILAGGTISLYLWQLGNGEPLAAARTVAVNTLVMFEVFYLLNARYILAPATHWRRLADNRVVLVAITLLLGFQMVFTYLPAAQRVFGTHAIGPGHWLLITAVSSTVFVLVEMEKWVIRRLRPLLN